MRNLVTAVLVLFFTVSVFAKSNVNVKTTYNKALAEASLLEGISSQNQGLSLSSANMLGEIKSSNAVIPLMKILRNSDNEASRITAAQALIKIGDARGVFAVKKAAEFDDSQRVRSLCAKFYFQSLIEG